MHIQTETASTLRIDHGDFTLFRTAKTDGSELLSITFQGKEVIRVTGSADCEAAVLELSELMDAAVREGRPEV